MRGPLLWLCTACVLVLLLMTVDPRAAHACLCARMGSTEKFPAAAAIFSGRVIETTSPYRQEGETIVLRPPFVSVTRFTVEHVWKGSLDQEVRVTTGFHDCAQQFEVGREYLVWAFPASGYPDHGVEGMMGADYGPCGLSRPGPISEQDGDVGVLQNLSRLPPAVIGLIGLSHRPLVPLGSTLVLLVGTIAIMGTVVHRRTRRRRRD